MAYSVEQEAALRAAQPITFAMAGEFAEEFGVSRGSVIAKVLSMELDYIRKPATPKRPRGVTKTELVAQIEARFNAEGVLTGLEKAPASALNALIEITESA